MIRNDFREVLSHCTGAGFKLGPLELCSRFEAKRRREGGREDKGANRRNKNRETISFPLSDLSFIALVVEFQLQSFRESNFGRKPPSFVTKVVAFYWQGCKVSGGEFLPQNHAAGDSNLM